MFNKVQSALILCLCFAWSSHANLVETIGKIKPSVVGVGVYTPLGQPRNELRGTGFAVADGQYVVTNKHVLPEVLDEELNQKMVVFVGNGKDAKPRNATIVDSDLVHDLALLKVEGNALPPMSLAKDKFIKEGSTIAFTGFPIGAILGLYPVNSGSAMYNQHTGEVIGVINKVFVQDTKEGAISNPSGITYAIPVKWVRELLKKNNVAI